MIGKDTPYEVKKTEIRGKKFYTLFYHGKMLPCISELHLKEMPLDFTEVTVTFKLAGTRKE